MAGYDDDLDLVRTRVNCAALLEKLAPNWKLDRHESTRRALKYRRGPGEILIVIHDGRGWWDPLSSAKGDVFDLIRHLEPGMTFGQIRQLLGRFVGVVPSDHGTSQNDVRLGRSRPVVDRWAARPRLRPGSPGWCYLADIRRLPPTVLSAASAADAVREGYRGSVWLAHRANRAVCHVEVRGPAFRGSLRGGHKTLFRFSQSGPVNRVVLAEAPIDALSVAAIEGMLLGTLYAATGGGMGPGTISSLEQLLRGITDCSGAMLTSATDANVAGDHYARRHADLAAAAGVGFERLRPVYSEDWNDVLRLQG